MAPNDDQQACPGTCAKENGWHLHQRDVLRQLKELREAVAILVKGQHEIQVRLAGWKGQMAVGCAVLTIVLASVVSVVVERLTR